MATATSSLPEQQPAGQTVANPAETVLSSNPGGGSSGSIGPFFAVMSVLTVLAVLSCVVGRLCSRGEPVSPLESIRHRGCVGWVKRRCSRRFSTGDVEVGRGKEVACGDERRSDGHEVGDGEPPQA